MIFDRRARGRARRPVSAGVVAGGFGYWVDSDEGTAGPGCSVNKPSAVVVQFADALKKNEIERAMTYMSSDMKVLGESKLKVLLTQTVREARSAGAEFEMEILDEEVNGDRALVRAVADGDTTEFDLVREDGEWKITTDLNAAK